MRKQRRSPSTVWKRGIPPGKYYPGMEDDYEIAFAPLAKWHRRRSPEEAFVKASRRALDYGKAHCIQQRHTKGD